MAKLPQARVRKRKLLLREMEVGRTAYLETAALLVDTELNCYLNPDAECSGTKTIFNVIKVERYDDGFHIALLAHWDWEPRTIKTESLLPVITVTEDYDPDVDRRGKPED